MVAPLDVEAVRAQFPALARTEAGRPVAYLDGPGGSQVAASTLAAMTAHITGGLANVEGAYATSIETDRVIAEARRGAADFLGVSPADVAFGQNMTSLAFALASALAPGWGPGDNIVVTELDHRANVDPWRRAARLAGAEVRWLPLDTERLTLDLSGLDGLIDPRTRFVAVGRAANGVGTVTDVRVIADRAHRAGALVAVDAVHAAPHLPTDRDALGADLLFCSAYKFFGPHLGMVAVAPGVWAHLDVARLDPAPIEGTGMLETGTQNHEAFAGLVGALDFIAGLGQGDDRRSRLLSGIERIEVHEDALAADARAALAEVPGIRMLTPAAGVSTTPTISFTLASHSPRAVAQHLAGRGLFVGDGNFYASTIDARLGTASSGGWVRLGLAPYNTADELARCVAALHELTSA